MTGSDCEPVEEYTRCSRNEKKTWLLRKYDLVNASVIDGVAMNPVMVTESSRS